MTRTEKRKHIKIMNGIIYSLLLVVVILAYTMIIPSYPNTQWQNSKTSIDIVSIKDDRNSLIEIKDNNGDLYYTHEVNKKYIEHNIDGGYRKFNITTQRSSFITIILKIKPRYEIYSWEVDY